MSIRFLVFTVLTLSKLVWAAEIQLLEDCHFQGGFQVLNPTHGKAVVESKLVLDQNSKPVWQLAQWHSRYSIADVELHNPIPDKYVFGNPAKKVIIGKPDSDWADLTLALNSEVEYKGRYRKSDEPWPHLLVSQGIVERCPSLADIKTLSFHLEAKLNYCQTEKKSGYDPALHCAQIPGVLIVQNRNRTSPGYGDFLWFQIPVFDDRYEFSPVMTMQDCADSSQKMIYSPGARAYLTEPVKAGHWVTIDRDIYPLVLIALETAWNKGYLKDSIELADYKITSVILGWEVTGLNRVSMQFRNFSFIANTGDDIQVDSEP